MRMPPPIRLAPGFTHSSSYAAWIRFPAVLPLG